MAEVAVMTMTGSTINPLHRGLVYEGHLPLSWKAVPTLPGDNEMTSLEYTNSEVLRTLFALESHPSDLGEDNEGKSQDLVRLDFKVNLLLDLVGQLLTQQLVIPEARELTLMANGILWQDTDPPPVASVLRIELYLNMRYPRPLVLHGRVQDIRQLPQNWTAEMEFYEQGESVREGLERFIFVQHRRTIAQNRLKNRRSFPES